MTLTEYRKLDLDVNIIIPSSTSVILKPMNNKDNS